MTDDRDELDPSDWLASQFADDPESDKPTAPPAQPVAQQPSVPPVQPPVAQPAAPPIAQPPAAPPFTPPPLASPPQSAPYDAAPTPQLPPVPPAVTPPAVTPSAAGGFNWGLTPSSDTPAPAPEPTPLPSEPAPYVPPASEPAPYVPPASEPAPYVPPAPEPAPYVPPAPEPAPYVPPASEPAPYVPPVSDPPSYLPSSPDPAPYIPPAATFSFDAPAPAVAPDPPATAFPFSFDPPAAQPVDPPAPAVPADQPTTALPVDQPTTAFPVDQPTTALPVDQPTTAFPRQELEAQPFDATQWLAAPVDPSLEGVTEVLEAELVGIPTPEGEGLETSAIDSLFGESQFTDYAGQSMIQVPPPRGPREGKQKKERGPLGALPRNQVILMWVAGGLVAALALVALFLLGTRLGGMAPAPAAIASPSPSPSASAAFVLGPVVPGEYVWDQLLGGECLEPWESAWDDRFTVVDCAKPHAAQMVHKGEFVDALDVVYPGVEELSKRINLLCTAPTIIDYTLAGSSKDIVVTASFAADADDWDEGNRTFYCFVTRSSGEDLTTSIAMPQVAPTPTPLPTP